MTWIVRCRAPIKGLFYQVYHSELAAATASTTSEQRNWEGYSW